MFSPSPASGPPSDRDSPGASRSPGLRAGPVRHAPRVSAGTTRRLVALAAAAAAVAAAADDGWKPAASPLTTEWGRAVTPDDAWRDHPRPQLVRDAWRSLNGLWEFAIVDRPSGISGPPEAGEDPPGSWDCRILVPFCPESSLSGVGRGVTPSQLLWYRRSLVVPDDWRGRRVMLHFEAVDWHATAWLNGQVLGEHSGGSDPFSFDVTDHLRPGDNELLVRAWDPTDAGPQPRGKQQLKPNTIWYTPVSGIWQSVWMEPVPETHVTGAFPVADLVHEAVEFTVEIAGGAPSAGRGSRVRIVGDTGSGRGVLGEAAAGEPIRCPVPDPRPWTPDDPHLYPVDVELVAPDGSVADRAGTYFAMRSISVGPDDAGIPRMLLNGKPLFQIGPLDQGWWPDGLLTPPSDAAMRHDLEVLKRLGMNMLRKHVKVEPARYYHHCDRLGLLVWQDQPSGMAAGRGHGVRPGAADDARFSPVEKAQFRTELGRMIDRLRFFPSIVVWVPFNEGWGQHDTNDVLRWVKDRDPTRLVDGPSGWTDRGVGDLLDMHVYPGPGMFPVQADRASVLGEFGGLGLPVKGHLWRDDGTWGYRTYRSEAELREAYAVLVRRLHALVGRGLAAAVYTQTTDVETEVNGLMTYDRAVLKLDPAAAASWHRRLFEPPPTCRDVVATSEADPATWRFATGLPAPHWHEPRFDDSDWEQGPGCFGAPGTPGATIRTEWRTGDIWLRRRFELAAEPVGELFVRAIHDDTAEVFVNGVPAATLEGHSASYVEVPLPDDARRTLRAGGNVVAVHCHQAGGGQAIDVGIVELVPAR